MPTHTTLRSLFSSIANAIRAKTGGRANIVADDFPTAIAAIPTGIFPRGTKPITITENGVVTEDVTNYASAEIITDVVGYKIYNDGATHLYISVNEVTRSLGIQLCVNGTVNINWGDGTSTSSLSGTSTSTAVRATHSYTANGIYHIRITAQEGTTYALPEGTSSGSVLVMPLSGSGGGHYRYALRFVECGAAQLTHDYAFADMRGLCSVILPSSCTTLPTRTVYGCSSITEITLPPTVTTLKSQCIQNVAALGAVTIPQNVVSIEAQAFSGCTGLREVHFKPSTPPVIGASSAFSSLNSGCKIYVPTGKLAAYTSAANYPSSSTYTYVEE